VAATFVLAKNSKIRYATGAMMYFAQGIPQGLLAIAIPAWLASLGVSASDIGSYLAVIALPWAFKLVTGPLMDRFEFLPMGRRRPWVLAAQFGLSISLLSLTLVEDPAQQIGLLMLVGVLINSFAATQDVAVDGMCIDLTPIREQGRLNGFMSFGKAIGWATSAAVSGALLVTLGLQFTAILAAAFTAALFIAFVFVIEREGERTLPWVAGKAASTNQQSNSFKSVFSGLNKVLWSRTSVVVMMLMFFDGLWSGFGSALMPIAAIKLFGYTTPQWSQLVAVMGLTGAVLALSLGPIIDKFGAKRMLFITILLVGLHAFIIAQTQHLWENTLYVRVMLSIWVMMQPVVMVCVLALAMAICSSTISATQFAIYMSTANLGGAVGSKFYGTVAETTSFEETYLLLSLLVLGAMLVLFFHRREQEDDEKRQAVKKAVPRHTLSFGGGGSVTFWSGAMRCPKCRADMEQLVYDDVEIDRCTFCKGLWFDAGEIGLLHNKEAAAAIDTGDQKTGKMHNTVNNYPCPRCAGEMVHMVDAKQTHIRYEECNACKGSFFDAGEFADLSEFTISDIFKRIYKPQRD
jgi:PAT family beta-lactamase induction signal transducer AmpG